MTRVEVRLANAEKRRYHSKMRFGSSRFASTALACAALCGLASSGSSALAAPSSNAARDVTYVVVPEGLKITVAGVKFIASAQAEQVGQGWGAKISIEASSDDGKAHSLTKPKAGPLAFAGSVTRKGKSDPEHFGDERAGEGDLAIDADKPTKFSRTWPAKGARPLAIGESLDLQAALWGLGEGADDRRPVKQFFHVRMEVSKGKPRAVIEPPASASGK